MLLTRCPECGTSFRAASEQLKVADGLVRCGQCQTVFDGLECVVEDSAETGQQDISGNNVWAGLLAPNLALLDTAPIEADRENTDEPDDAMSESGGSDSGAGRDKPEQDTESFAGTVEPEAEVDVEDTASEIPSALLPAAPANTVAVHSTINVIMAAGLIVLLAGQYLWFQRNDALNRFPELDGFYDRLCGQLPCPHWLPADIPPVRLVSREVRGHPEATGALLVSAMIENPAAMTRPWPLLNLTLFNITGSEVASRSFTPGQYIDSERKLAKQMPSKQPVSIRLELIGLHTHGAVSYEFDFSDPL